MSNKSTAAAITLFFSIETTSKLGAQTASKPVIAQIVITTLVHNFQNKSLCDSKTTKIKNKSNNISNILSESNVGFLWKKKYGKVKTKSNGLSGKISTCKREKF